MLILPLHKPLNRENFPWMTMMLLIINVYVFFALQSADRGPMAAVKAYYLSSGIAKHEVPAYRRYLIEGGRGKELQELDDIPEQHRAKYVGAMTISDHVFVRRLAEGELIDDLGAWQPLRREYDALLAKVFTLRHVQRFSEWSPRRLLSAMFLHSGAMHLLGNMLFLLALGLLLEGAIGSLRMLLLYMLGGFGAGVISVLWRWGESGAGLGASGAIAAVMGAFCVVWGRQRVRFFYWFGVVFDYVRAPALWLFPVWLGWEVYKLLFSDQEGVAFDAHIGGLICGAVLGGCLVWLGQTRPDFMLASAAMEPEDDRLSRALQHMGRMENSQAERLLAELDAERPGQFELVLARCRVARNAGARERQQQCSLQLLGLVAADKTQVQAQLDMMRGLLADGVVVPTGMRTTLATNWLTFACLAEVEAMLAMPTAAVVSREELAQCWLQLAQNFAVRGDGKERDRILWSLIEHYPEQPQAAKARFLLGNS